MTSRPQFSLRMLLFVTTLACLAAATATDLPGERQLARGAQAALAIALCFVFAAMFTAGAVVSRGYAQTLYVAGLFPAVAPLVIAGIQPYHCHWTEGRGFSPAMLRMLWNSLSASRGTFAMMWAAPA